MALTDLNLTPFPAIPAERIYQLSRAFALNGIIQDVRVFPTYQGQDNKIPDRYSYLGSRVVSNLSICGTTYTTGNGQKVTFPDLQFDAVLFNVQNTKNIIYTPIQGKDGTVKEYIAGGDYDIQVKGIITGLNGQYPDKYNGAQSGNSNDTINVVDNLIDAMNCNTELTINSWYLTQLFGINTIVITSFELYQEEGNYSQQRFSFTAKSDQEYQVVLNA